MTITKNVSRIPAPEINMSLGTITWKVPGVERPVTVYTERCHKDILSYAVIHGIKARVQDGAALMKDEHGRSASWADKAQAMQDIADHLMSGSPEWNMRGGGARVGTSDIALLVSALMELGTNTREEALAWVKSKSPDVRAALMLNEKVKPIVDRMRQALAAECNTQELLGELLDAE